MISINIYINIHAKTINKGSKLSKNFKGAYNNIVVNVQLVGKLSRGG